MTKDTVAYLGEKGAFSEIAAKKYFGEANEFVPCGSFEIIFSMVTDNTAQAGIIPIENSLAGSIHKNYDLLLKYDLWISGETDLRIEHNLIVNPGTKLENIKRIYSHPQALSQCEEYLSTLDGVETVSTESTAGSVKLIKEREKHEAAAIASETAAKQFDMQILEAGIEDDKENYTRFLALTKEQVITRDANKTSIVFSTKNTPGVLFKSLSVFALRDISLSKIESRPLRGKPWEYFFYIDIEDNIENERCKNAIEHLKEIADFLKILGCYKQGLK